MIRILDEDNEKEWNRETKKSNAPIQYSLKFKEAIEKAYPNCKPKYFIGEKCLYPFFLVKSKIFGKKLISLPFLDVGGFLGNPSEEEIKKIIEKAKEEKVKKIEVRLNNFAENFEISKRILEKIGFLEENQKQQFIIKLMNENEMWRNFHKHTRNDIRKAEKSGLSIKIIENKKDLKNFYKLYVREMKRFGTPQHSYSFFSNLFNSLQKNFLGLNCYFEDHLIASLIMLNNSKNAYIAFNVSDEKYRSYRPNDLLYWEIVKLALKNKIEVIDMGQVDKNAEDGTHAYGLYKFKEKWLGKIYERTYFTFYIQKEDNHLKKDNLKKYRKIWKKIPSPILRIIGPKICRELGV